MKFECVVIQKQQQKHPQQQPQPQQQQQQQQQKVSTKYIFILVSYFPPFILPATTTGTSPCAWTGWLDRDDPSGTEDNEAISIH